MKVAIIILVFTVVAFIVHRFIGYFKNNNTRSMIKELMYEVDNAMQEALVYISRKDYISYILLIGRADMIPGLKAQVGTIV